MRRYIVALTCSLLTLIALFGCGANESEPTVEVEESVSVASWEDIGLDMSGTNMVQVIGDTIYQAEWEWDQDTMMSKNTRITKQSRGYGEVELAMFRDGQHMAYFLADESGAIYSIYFEETEGVRDYFLRKDDNQGEVYCVELQVEGDSAIWFHGGIVSLAGELCFLSTDGTIYLFDGQGIFVKKVASGRAEENRCGFINCTDDIFFYEIENTQVFLCSFDMKTGAFGRRLSVSLAADSDWAIKVLSGYEKGVLLSDGKKLWGYFPKTEEKLELVNWSDTYVGIKAEYVEQIGVLEDAGLYVLLYDYAMSETNMVLIQAMSRDEVAGEDSVVIIGYCGNVGGVVEDLVKEYNKINVEYKYEISIYETSDALYMDLLRGRGPDILFGFPKRLFKLEGVLEDLSPYFASSEYVQESDLLPSVRKACSVDGKLVSIGSKFWIWANLAEKDYAKNGGWTTEEYLSLAEKHPGASLSRVREETFELLSGTLAIEVESYVNWEEKECVFQSDRFIEILERYKKNFVVYNDPADQGITGGEDYFLQLAEDFRDNKFLVYSLNISSIMDYLEIKDAFFEKADLLGEPNPEGTPWYRISIWDSFSINSASSHKEGAWKFLEYMLSEKYQSSILYNGFPVRTDAFEARLERGHETEGYSNSYLGFNVSDRVPWPEYTESDKEFIRYMVENAYYKNPFMGEIRLIISEELPAFFVGDKTAKEVAEIIQNRASLYLNE